MNDDDSKFLIKLIIAGLVIITIVLIWSFVKTRTEYESFKEDLSMRTRNLEAKDEYLEREVKKLKEDTNELELDIRRSRGTMDKDMVRQIDNYLKNTDMVGLGEKIVIEAELYDIEPRLAPAVARVETNCGKVEGLNIFGMWKEKLVDSKEEEIEQFFKLLNRTRGRPQVAQDLQGYAMEKYDDVWIEHVQIVVDEI